MVKYTFLETPQQIILQSLIASFGTIFIIAYILFMCAGKKKNGSNSKPDVYGNAEKGLEEGNDLKTPKNYSVEQQQQKSNTPLSHFDPSNNKDNDKIISKENGSSSRGGGVESEMIRKYDPNARKKEMMTGEDSGSYPYETITNNQPAVKEIKKTDMVENSGNSDSGDSIYTKVKTVETEEIAYAVVNIEESLEKYETINGDIVRKQNSSADTSRDDGEYEENTNLIINQNGNLSTKVTNLDVKNMRSISDSSREIGDIERKQRQKANSDASSELERETKEMTSTTVETTHVCNRSKNSPRQPNDKSQIKNSEFPEENSGSSLYASVKENLEENSKTTENSNQKQSATEIPADDYAVVNKQRPASPSSFKISTKIDIKENENIEKKRDDVSALYATVIPPVQRVHKNEKYPENSGNSTKSSLYPSVNDNAVTGKHVEQEENSGDSTTSSLYAAVSNVDATTRGPHDEQELHQENSGNSMYAAINEKQTKTQKLQQENSGNSTTSSLYAGIDDSDRTTSDPLPPPLPKNTGKRPSICSLSLDCHELVPSSPLPVRDDSTNHMERDNTYDMISDVVKLDLKMENKQKQQPKRGSKEINETAAPSAPDVKTTKDGKKQSKIKHSNSHKASKESKKGGIFKKYQKNKKIRKSNENIDVEANSGNFDNLNHQQQSEDEDAGSSSYSPQFKDKVASLPMSMRSPKNDLGKKRHSVPHVPPPLPSVDRLKHLTEHNKSQRGTSFDACSSGESSPRSTPQAPFDIHHHPPPSSLKFPQEIKYDGDVEEDDKYSTINFTTTTPDSRQKQETSTEDKDQKDEKMSKNKHKIDLQAKFQTASGDEYATVNLQKKHLDRKRSSSLKTSTTTAINDNEVTEQKQTEDDGTYESITEVTMQKRNPKSLLDNSFSDYMDIP